MTRVAEPKRTGRLITTIAAVSAGGAVVAGLAGFAGLSYAVARFIVTPAAGRHERIRIISVDRTAGTVALTSTADTRLPGRYGFLFDDGRGYARLGDVVHDNGRVVVRNVDAVDEGVLSSAKRGRLLGWYYRRPADLGLPFSDVTIDTEVGPAPAWLVPPADVEPGADTPSKRWAVVVHGRGVVRGETLRAVPAFREEDTRHSSSPTATTARRRPPTTTATASGSRSGRMSRPPSTTPCCTGPRAWS
ncbi:hypothetical protein GCM10025867_30190 [Frondihabitans sucicola]|uniref:Uncharacterized protein n=1 Tax=Frondihabitans sucicola TaxID=1268041 RepID=A0ABM8GQN3_9MICO|nr:hypothetical protein GCM10025867_30190 [Frondihabitans sucicola]